MRRRSYIRRSRYRSVRPVGYIRRTRRRAYRGGSRF